MVGITLAIMIAGAMVGALADVRTRRIPNLLTGTLAAIAIAAGAAGGVTGVAGAALVMAATFLAGTVAFSLGWFGGGDVKLLTACAGLAGYPGAVSVVLYTLLAGGFVCVADAIRRRRLASVLTSTLLVARGAPSAVERSYVPYGIAIAAGTCIYALSLTAFPMLRLHL